MEKTNKSKFSLGAFRQLSLLLVLAVMVILFSLMSPFFMQRNNILNIMRQVSTNAVCAVAMTMIIIMGEIDLSVGSMLAFLSVIGAMTFNALPDGTPPFLKSAITLLAAMTTGAVISGLGGLLTATAKIPAFVTTLALMEGIRGLAFIITNGSPVPISSPVFKVFGSGWVLNLLPVPVVIMLIIILLGVFLMKYTRFGRYIYSIGGSIQASKWSGIKTSKIKTLVFVLSGALYGLAAMIMAGRLGGGYPATASGAEMNAIAATILGGTSLSGGKGNIWGTIIGVFIIGVINTGLTLLDVSVYWQQVLSGVIILVAVMIDTKNKAKA